MGKGKECLAEESAGAVIEKYSNMVYRLAYARTGSRHDADDIYQEVFLRYFRRKPVFDSEEHRKAWLLRVTVNCSNSFLSAPWQRRTMGLPEDLPYEGGRKDHLDLQNTVVSFISSIMKNYPWKRLPVSCTGNRPRSAPSLSGPGSGLPAF